MAFLSQVQILIGFLGKPTTYCNNKLIEISSINISLQSTSYR